MITCYDFSKSVVFSSEIRRNLFHEVSIFSQHLNLCIKLFHFILQMSYALLHLWVLLLSGLELALTLFVSSYLLVELAAISSQFAVKFLQRVALLFFVVRLLPVNICLIFQYRNLFVSILDRSPQTIDFFNVSPVCHFDILSLKLDLADLLHQLCLTIHIISVGFRTLIIVMFWRFGLVLSEIIAIDDSWIISVCLRLLNFHVYTLHEVKTFRIICTLRPRVIICLRLFLFGWQLLLILFELFLVFAYYLL